MVSSNSRRHGLAALAGVFLLLSGLGPVSLGKDLSDPAAEARRDSTALYQVDTDREPDVVRAFVDSIVDRVMALTPQLLTLPGGNKVFVPKMTSKTEIEIDLGIIVDDGVPF